MQRKADIERQTKETSIRVSLDLDDRDGVSSVATGLPFVDHMLTAMARHGHFQLVVQAEGDLHIDAHHTIEDLGITLGRSIRQALGDRIGIRRFGSAIVPMDEALVRVVIDISGRPYLGYRLQPPSETVGGFHSRLFQEFFQALVNTAGLTVHIDALSGEEVHHVFEATFKAFGRALDQACESDPCCTGVPSTKGVLE